MMRSASSPICITGRLIERSLICETDKDQTANLRPSYRVNRGLSGEIMGETQVDK